MVPILSPVIVDEYTPVPDPLFDFVDKANVGDELVLQTTPREVIEVPPSPKNMKYFSVD